MRNFLRPAVSNRAMLLALLLAAARPASAGWDYDARDVRGWTVRVRRDFSAADLKRLPHALAVLDGQLARVAAAVPEPALSRLKRLTIYVSPPYRGFPQGCAYHPDAAWLTLHGRDPAMARGVECMCVSHMEQKDSRMPYFVLHELAHGYHDQVLGFADKEIKAAYAAAKAGGAYDHVERVNWPGQPHTRERAYALQNEREYFAEDTEAFFGRNDFYPFTRTDLEKADPAMEKLLREKWGAH